MPVVDLSRATPQTPVRVGRYDVVGLLGRGGMAAVYEAIDIDHGTKVALKTITDLDPVSLLRFKREFRQVADLDHPNLVALYELSCHEGLWFFTMERVVGVDFLEHLGHRLGEDADGGPAATRTTTVTETNLDDLPGASRALPPIRALPPAAVDKLRESLSQLVRAVRALHHAGLLHLDIKPSNIIVEPSGRVVLLDFGVTREVGAESAANKRVSGTPAWMAPEQHEGDSLTEASDWYAVGLVLYTALTGTFAFPVHSLASAMSYAKHRGDPVPPNYLADVPADLTELTLELLRSDPDLRPNGDAVLRTLTGDSGNPRLVGPRRATLVGREMERAHLGAALGRVLDGGSGVVQLSGPSGVGKSALLPTQQSLGNDGDAFVLCGRCYERESVPYKAFDAIVDDLARRLSTLDHDQVVSWLPPWTEELTRSFPVLGSVPAIEQQMEAAKPIASTLRAAEIQRRAIEALRIMFASVAADRCCVVVIDDLQWADADSARALGRLVQHPMPPGLLVVLAYRSNSVDHNPAVREVLSTIEAETNAPRESDAAQYHAVRVAVGPLNTRDATTLAHKRLGDDAQHLAAQIGRASGGVPFYIEELAHLATQQMGSGTPPKVELDDVIAQRVLALGAEERAVVETLAVAGSPIPLSVAISVAGIEDGGVRRALWSLRRKDFVRGSGARPGDAIALRHDGLREAVVRGLDIERVDALHLGLGSALVGPEGSSESPWLFDAARHLNMVATNAAGDDLDDASRLRIARINLAAGQRARHAAAFALAFSYFQSGAQILGQKEWDEHYELPLALHAGAADAAYLTGAWAAVTTHVDAVKANATSVPDQVGAWEAEIDAHIARREYGSAVDAGRDALSRMHVELPADPDMASIGREMQESAAVLASVGPAGLPDLPLASDPMRRASMRLLSRISSAAYFARPNLLPVIACRIIGESVRHGLTAATHYGLSIYGIVLNAMGQHVEAHAWGQTALSLIDRFDDRSLDARTGHVVHDLVCNWVVPLAETLPNMWGVYETGKSLGDVEYASYAAHAYIHNGIYAGLNLNELLPTAIEVGNFMRSQDQGSALLVHSPFEQLLRAFTSAAPNPAVLDGSGFSEQAALAAADAAGSLAATCVLRVSMGIARYSMGTAAQAAEILEPTRPFIDSMPSVWHVPIFHQFSALAILGLETEARKPLMQNVQSSLDALGKLAEIGPMNFAHRVELLSAERARVENQPAAAREHCDRAIALAREHNWPHDLGIALEVSERIHLAAGASDDAARDRAEARDVYTQWGATAKAAQLG